MRTGRAVALLTIGVASMLGGLIWFLWPHHASLLDSYRGSWTVVFEPNSTHEARQSAIDACSSLPGVIRSGVMETSGPPTGFVQGPFGPPHSGALALDAQKSSAVQAAAVYGCLKAQPGVKSVVAG